MTHQDIIAHLCQLQPPQVVHEITTENIMFLENRSEYVEDTYTSEVRLSTYGQNHHTVCK